MRFTFPDKTFNALSLAVIGAAVVLMIGGIVYYTQQERQRKAIEDQTSKTNQLITEVKNLTLEVRDLSKDNKKLSEQNRNYAYCNAVLIARYTQTLEPIVIEDLDKCILNSFPQQTESGGQSQNFFTPQTTQPSSVAQSTANPQQPVAPSVPNNPQPNNPQTPPSNNPPQTNDPQPSNNVLTIPNLLELNTPCLQVLGIVKTCE